MVTQDNRITYGVLINSLRKYIEDTTGVTAVWRYIGYKPPSSGDYVAVEFVNSVYTSETKLKELVNERVFFNLSNIAKDVVSLDIRQGKLIEILMYHRIPLINYSGQVIGEFSVTDITAVNQIGDGTQIETETGRLRTYTDFYVDVNHIKKRT